MRLLTEQGGALLQRLDPARLREALLIGLRRGGARRRCRAARLRQGAPAPEPALESAAENRRVDSQPLQGGGGQRLRASGRLNGLRLVDVREVELEVELERI